MGVGAYKLGWMGLLVLSGALSAAWAKQPQRKNTASAENTATVTTAGLAETHDAEATLIRVYRLIADANMREALQLAEALVQRFPSFQLAQLVYGDLLQTKAQPLRWMGDVPEDMARNATLSLDALREESSLRLKALRERPPEGALPDQFLLLSGAVRHAIAVDASKSRLYLFQNTGQGLQLLSDHYISVGKLGMDKRLEGDQRTPLGVYFITQAIDRKRLKDFYGAGALPLNYPNVLDQRLGRTGSGIWLHGTPSEQYVRAPKASDGCVVLANPDLEKIMRTVEVRSTPVVIANQLNWVVPQSLGPSRQSFHLAFEGWRLARSQGDLSKAMAYYSGTFSNNGKTVNDWQEMFEQESQQYKGRALLTKDLSILRSPAFAQDSKEAMVVTFSEYREGSRQTVLKRQYWLREKGFWKIVYEGVLS